MVISIMSLDLFNPVARLFNLVLGIKTQPRTARGPPSWTYPSAKSERMRTNPSYAWCVRCFARAGPRTQSTMEFRAFSSSCGTDERADKGMNQA